MISKKSYLISDFQIVTDFDFALIDLKRVSFLFLNIPDLIPTAYPPTWLSKGIPFLLVPGLEVKRSMGMVRGKNDKADARMIARYGHRMRDGITPTELSSEEGQSIKRPLDLRQRLVKQRSGYGASIKEQSRVLVKKHDKTLLYTQERMVTYLTKQGG